MGHQITYYVSDSLSKDIRIYARSLGLDIVVKEPHNSYIINPGDEIETLAYIIYFYDCSLGEIILNSETGLINDSASPVIQVCQTKVCHTKKVIYSGRLWISSFYYTKSGKKISQSKVLEHKYKKIVSFIKKHTVYQCVSKSTDSTIIAKVYVSEDLLCLSNKMGYCFK